MSAHAAVPADFEAWPDAARAEWQLGALRETLAYAGDRSEVYRAVWGAAGVGPDDVATIDDFHRLPIVHKGDFVEALPQGVTRETTAVGFSTRGTSGMPLVVWLDELESVRYTLPCARGFRWAGLRAGDRALLLNPGWHRLAAMEGHAALQLGAVPCHFWGTVADLAHVDYFLDAIRDHRPQFVSSTPPFLLTAVRRCDKTGIDLHQLFSSVRSVSLVGLALTPGLRRHLADRLGVEHVFERGGTQEGAALDECELHTGMHVHEDVCYLEVVDGDGRPCPTGTAGRLLVTKLVPGGSPFVRYDTGDRAAFLPGRCACGIAFPRLRMLGRPESTVFVQGRPVTAFEVRRILDERADLVGRISVLVHDRERPDLLRIEIEGGPVDPDPGEEIAASLGVEHVRVDWLHGTEVVWGFRQVVDVKESRTGGGR